MTSTSGFLRFAAICCAVTVITTLGIHLGFPDPPADFEARAALARDSVYLANRWWIVVHCLLALVAMWGFVLAHWQRAAALVGLGFVFFVVFAITEVARQMYLLFYVNQLRELYLAAADPGAKSELRSLLQYAGQLSSPLFGLFILAFGLGNLCYGLSLWRERGFGRWLGALLVVWGVTTLLGLGNSFWRSASLTRVIELYNFTYQPLMRGLLAVWLWRQAAALRGDGTSLS